MSVAEISEQLNLTSIKDHGWHIQVKIFTAGATVSSYGVDQTL